MKELITRLIDARCAQGLTQSEVANAIGRRQSVISDWESGRHFPNLRSLESWAGYLGFKVVLAPVEQQGGAVSS